MEQNERLITKWAPALLLMELDNVLWGDKDSISIKKLWDYLCAYCYLPRLANYGVLEDAIWNGLNSSEYYALAAAISGERYIDLKYNQYVGMIDTSAHLVKIMAALKQIAEDKAKVQAEDGKATSVTYPQGGLQPGHVNESGEYGGRKQCSRIWCRFWHRPASRTSASTTKEYAILYVSKTG